MGLAAGFTLKPELKRESWALVAVPQAATPQIARAELEKLQPWGALWKRRGFPEFRWLRSDPLCTSEDQAMTRVTNALRMSPSFVKRHVGGDFYMIPLRYCLHVPALAGKPSCRELQSLLIAFGLSTSYEVAMGKVEAALRYGTPWPAKTAQWWREKLAGSVVVPVPVHKRVVVEEVPGAAL